jgi:hypothetical protein
MPLNEGGRAADSPLFDAAKTLVQDWEDRVSLAYPSYFGWPAMEELTKMIDEIEEARATLANIRKRWEEEADAKPD